MVKYTAPKYHGINTMVILWYFSSRVSVKLPQVEAKIMLETEAVILASRPASRILLMYTVM